MTATQTMIEAQGLTKVFGEVKAIEDVTFTLKRGEILGFLGPNGAGKTTTMKILTCFISPTSGTARVNGHDVFEQSIEARRNTGYLPENAPLYGEMTVLEDLRFFAEMRGVPAEKRAGAVRRVVETCGLGEVIGREIRELSKGFRQRVGLAQAMVHDPEILVLDEPTSGLDPNQIVEIRGLVKELGRRKTIILSTHNLAEVQATCGRVIIIDKGHIVADDTPEKLSEKQEGVRHTIVTLADNISAVREAVEKVDGVVRTEVADEPAPGEAAINVLARKNADVRAALACAVIDAGAPLLEMSRHHINLEDIFRGLTVDRAKPRGSAKKRRASSKEE